MNNKIYKGCRICGYGNFYNDELPWGEDGETPTFNFCPCCGCEFGYVDCKIEAIREYRNTWIKNSAKWYDQKIRPINWSLEEQLKKIPKEYL